MSCTRVLTVVSGSTRALPATVESLRSALAGAGADLGETVTLSPDRAFDLGFDGISCAEAESVARKVLDGQPFDVVAQDTAGRRKRLLLADLESTVIRNEMLDELAALVGVGEQVAAITARAMNGALDFTQSLEARVKLLAGQPLTLLDEARQRIDVNPGAATLVSTMRAHGAEAVLLSGGFHRFADPLAARLGFDRAEANRLEVEEDRLTGRVLPPIVDRQAKADALARHCRRLGISADAVIAVGDGANDLAMLDAAGAGVAFHAKPLVARAARMRVDHGDLRTLLFFQGYAETTWRSPAD